MHYAFLFQAEDGIRGYKVTGVQTCALPISLLYETIVARDLPVRRVVVASSQAVYGEGAVRCEEHGVLSPGPRTMDQLAKRSEERRVGKEGRAQAAPAGEEHNVSDSGGAHSD